MYTLLRVKALNLLLVLCLAVSTKLCAESWSFTNKSNQVISFDWVTSGQLNQECEVFVKSFMKAYETLSLEDLKIESKEDFLSNVFNDEVKDLNDKDQNIYFVTAKHDNRVVGLACFNQTENAGEVYIRELAVDPEYWSTGIGKELVFSILKHLPETKSLVLVTRKINKIGCDFYKALNFQVSDYTHRNFDDRYIGFEYKF